VEKIRVLIYKGNPKWIDRTLDNSIRNSYNCGSGTIQSMLISEAEKDKTIGEIIKEMNLMEEKENE